MHRLRGRYCCRCASTLTAEDSYRQALAVAQQQSAKLWELRAATSLARLWRDQGKRKEARDLLAPVYGWFTEGSTRRSEGGESVARTHWRDQEAPRRFATGSKNSVSSEYARALCGERHRSLAAPSLTIRSEGLGVSSLGHRRKMLRRIAELCAVSRSQDRAAQR